MQGVGSWVGEYVEIVETAQFLICISIHRTRQGGELHLRQTLRQTRRDGAGAGW